LEKIFISPAQHQLHHSIENKHFNKNYGAMLAIWDWLFGSLHFSETGKSIRFGLRPNEASATNIISIYLKPFVEISNIAKYFYTTLVKFLNIFR
jgi:sterol desaturase/sphingolipid hydroxylase (fatty acid hydroxylase superfamily)